MGNIHSNPNAEINEDLIRHCVLTTILSYKKKFGQQYGEIILAADDKNYWRKDVFPYYKSNRKISREKSKFDWKLIFNTLNKIRDEIKNTFPYIVIQVEKTEADDIIATLVKYTNEFPLSCEPVMIISGDKDFIQLQKYDNVKQYSPMQKKFITHDCPEKYLKEHIMRGDPGDGVPNFLTEDDIFILDGKRQKPLRKTKLEEWINKKPEDFCDSYMLRNYKRNEQLIDLSFIPAEIENKILEEYKKGPIGERSKLFNYFIKNRLKYLMESISEF